MSVSEERKTIKMRGGCHGNYKVEAETLQSRRGRGTDLVAGRGRGPVQAGGWYLVRKVACGLRRGPYLLLGSEHLGHMSPGETRASLQVFA